MTLRVTLLIFAFSATFSSAELFNGVWPLPNFSKEATEALEKIKNSLPVVPMESNRTPEPFKWVPRFKRAANERKLQLRDDESAERFPEKRKIRKYWRRRPKIPTSTEIPTPPPVNPVAKPIISEVETAVKFPNSGEAVIKSMMHDMRTSPDTGKRVPQGGAAESVDNRGFYVTVIAKTGVISTKVRKGGGGSNNENAKGTGAQEYPEDMTQRNDWNRMAMPCTVIEITDQQNQGGNNQQAPINYQRSTKKTGNFTELTNATEAFPERNNESIETAPSNTIDRTSTIVENRFTIPPPREVDEREAVI